MASTRAIVLQIVPTSGPTFEFDVQGTLSSRIRPIRNELDEVVEVQHQWVMDNALLRTADGTVESTWDRWHAFTELAEARTGSSKIATIRVVRDPDGANATEIDFADSNANWENLRLEEAEGGGVSEISPDGTWVSVVPISLTLSARKQNADANGITSVTQSVSNTYTNGLHKLVWETTIQTKEGVDAVAKAKEFAAIDITAYGTFYAYQTNNDWGVSWNELDPDTISENGPRVVTEVRAISVIQEFGTEVGTTGPGSSPDTVEYVIRDSVQRDEIVRTVFAKAEGPGARSWVLQKKPSGGIWSEETSDGKAGRSFEATWTRKSTQSQDPVKDANLLSVEYGGGAREQVEHPTTSGGAPILFEGGFTFWICTVNVVVQGTGDQLKSADMPLPGKLPGWTLDKNKSTETGPQLIERGAERTGDRWERKAKLVYRRATKPTVEPLKAIRGETSVESFFL